MKAEEEGKGENNLHIDSLRERRMIVKCL